jgi:choline dehydrogenase-like flavoprotein
MDHYDVIIIGSGAGGGTLARHLAPSGKRILLLERGDWLPREPENWSAADVFVDNRYVSPDTWYDADGKAFQPQVHYCVGGATKMYGAALYRMRAEDFGELRHHGGISPAWPIPYEAMEAYYTKAEQLYQVHGARGEDPTEPFASAPYPHAAVSHEPRIAALAEAFAAVGLHPFHAPCGVMLNEGNMPYSACVRCSTCDGFPCLVHAKSDAEVLGVRPALEHANVTLLTGAKVVALKTNPAGTAVTEVVVERADEGGGTGGRAVAGTGGRAVAGTAGRAVASTGTGGRAVAGTRGGDGKGERETYAADIVVVSCGAANTAKLLLDSATDKHPNGLANGSDQVGRNYMFHNSQAVLAISKEPNPTVFQKTLGVNDYYFASDAWEFPMGNIQMVGKSVADMYRGEKPLMTRLAPTFSLADVAEHAVDFWLSTEDIPQAENRVSVDREGRLTLSYRAGNDTARDRLFGQLRSLLGHLGMHEHHLIPRWAYLENKIPVAGVAHQAGTCRFGSDPASSALNTDCRAHELDNLYVVDTSFFPSISAVNPALTAMANALRVGDHLLERLGANGG